MFSRFFIDRPIFSTVLSILLVLAGVITVKTLPIAQYPNISPPTVEVSATYPGADATTVAEASGENIEQAVNGVEGMLYMSSNSDNNGSYSLQITFENGTDLDDASVKVQNLVSQASPQLPSSVTQQGVSVNARSSSILLFVAPKAMIRSDTMLFILPTTPSFTSSTSLPESTEWEEPTPLVPATTACGYG